VVSPKVSKFRQQFSDWLIWLMADYFEIVLVGLRS
jgi:hypothetical protein